jgi:hypothetical protein
MNAEIVEEIEFLKDLERFCQFARRSKARPARAIPAAKWEMLVKERLEELERLETPPLPLGKPEHHKVAA